MKPVAFDYVRADDESEALEVLERSGSGAILMAGGMSLGPMLNMRLVRPSVVVDLGRIEALRAVETSGEEIRIGAMARQCDVMADRDATDAVPLLALALPHVGHFQTRSRGTFGGSLAHADPSAEIPLALVTLGGAVELKSRREKRRVAADEFITGMLSTVRRADEMITATCWPRKRASTGYAFAEFAQRHGDFAIASAACSVEIDDAHRLASIRLGLGGVEDRPVLIDTSKFINAETTGETASAMAQQAAASLEPLEDMTASADYRRALAVALVRQVLEAAFERARA